MRCNDDILYVRAGDAWSLTFSYKLEGVSIPLPDGARLEIRSATGAVVLTASGGAGLTINTLAGTIEMQFSGTQTDGLAAANKRTELQMGLKVFDLADEDATEETIAVATVIALPRAVS